jgi:hypothetical protein
MMVVNFHKCNKSNYQSTPAKERLMKYSMMLTVLLRRSIAETVDIVEFVRVV